MSRMGCLKTINSTWGLGSTRHGKVKGIKTLAKESKVKILAPLTYEEWIKVTITVKKNGVRIPIGHIPSKELGLMYGAYLSRYSRK
jgi:hypothetical protein